MIITVSSQLYYVTKNLYILQGKHVQVRERQTYAKLMLPMTNNDAFLTPYMVHLYIHFAAECNQLIVKKEEYILLKDKCTCHSECRGEEIVTQ